MIKTTRSLKPQILTRHATQWTDELCAERQRYYVELSEFNDGQRTRKPVRPEAKKTRYAHEEIKERLRNMFGGKCAYCEGLVVSVSYQHVEHFRPQSIYPGLAYRWDNLLFACPRCNSGMKRDQFPLIGGSHPVEDPSAPCTLDGSDANVLIDPCVDDPAEHFLFQDEVIVGRNDRARTTIQVCGLNREDLKDARREFLALIELAAKLYLSVIVRENENEDSEEARKIARTLSDRITPFAQFTAMAQAKLTALGINLEAILSEA